MKNIFPTLLIINLLTLACTKTGYDFTQNQGKDPAIEKTAERASYSLWLPAYVPYLPPGNIYKIITGKPTTLTFSVFKYGKVLVFERADELSQPHSLPRDRIYRTRYMVTARRTYFTYHVANITVYDSLLMRFRYPSPFAFSMGNYYNSEFRCIIVPPALKMAAEAAGLDWKDYNAVTSYFKIQP